MTAAFGSVRIVGGLLPSDLLGKIAAGDSDVPVIGPQTYHLQPGESVRQQAARSWDYLLGVWREFRARLDGTPESQWTQLTRERWLHILMRELDFRELRANPGIEHDGKPFPVSHRQDHIPVHLLGWRADLDHRTPGRTARAPQSMTQELLNRSEGYLWAVLSNGSSLRLLRDSRKLGATAYVEFDLQAMFDGELFPDFVLLYRVCNRSVFEPVADGGQSSWPLERWLAFASEAGTRALERLRDGVEKAVSLLGTGFLSHPDNWDLRRSLNGSHELRIEDFNHALLRVVYRLLFWFVAEDRDVLLSPDADAEARERYVGYFSSARLRRLAARRRGSGHSDLWEAVRIVFDALGNEQGVSQLGLPGIGGLFEPSPLDEPLDGARLANRDLLPALAALAIVTSADGGGRRPVDFGNLGAEELGSVYESLLEQVPRYNPEDLTYHLIRLAGNDRKETGSYYTPSSLVDCLLDSALDPLLGDACAAATAPERIDALLDITVCDPACGSGHFLVAAARRIATRLAAEETGEPVPTDAAVRTALRRVAGRCIYGVDINPMAVELAKVSLWMEAVEPGRPMPFLDANIRPGNSLLGTTPELIRRGVPSEAFKPIEGDDKNVAKALRKDNEADLVGQADLFSVGKILVTNATVAADVTALVRTLPGSLEDAHIQEHRFKDIEEDPERTHAKLVADAWCSAFVQPKTLETRAHAITDGVLRRLDADPDSVSDETQDLIRDFTSEYRFFHWHVEFPHIFRTGSGVGDASAGWSGGFSCVVGNPPWERVKLQEQEFFASRDADIAQAPNAAARKKMIAALADSDEPGDRELYAAFAAELRKSAGWSHLLRESGRYQLTGHGDINTYAVFAETGTTVIAPHGRLGFVLPTGIGTDATTAPFFRDLVKRSALASFLDFENEAFLLSRAVHHSVRFCLLTACGRQTRVKEASFAFGTRHMEQLAERRFRMPPEEILLVNPNTGTCPVFRSRRDAEITIGIYRRIPVILRKEPFDNPWAVSYMTMFHMTNDSELFETRTDLENAEWRLDGNLFEDGKERMLPLYEARMTHQFDHRFGTYEGQTKAQANVGTLPHLTPEQKWEPDRVTFPRYWVSKNEVTLRLARRKFGCETALLGHRRVARSSDERTCIAALIPSGAVTYGLILSTGPTAAGLCCLIATYNSFVYDYLLRNSLSQPSVPQSTSEQIAVPSPSTFNNPANWEPDQDLRDWVECRVLELTYTAYDMRGFARDLGDDGAPFQWGEERRELLRSELDAAYFHLYGVERDDVDYIMETFPVVERRDEERFGEYRTKRLILEIYDAMAEAIRTGVPYQTVLDPPPGCGPRHPQRPAG